ncbi:uncharacterized protein LOC126843527 [Adelges cooleyi]|uniref:uncharacterized protein LOC126843527 n=1 Tax=Adelges cooleyi TaxID=133065 RepID=UPI00217F8BB3|nr:uncharacterized protein LOC126843527 [Adelges cooleyi]
MNAKHLFIMCLLSIGCQIAKSTPADIEELWIELKIETGEMDNLMKKVEEKQEEIWKTVEIKEAGQSKGYTTKDNLIKVLSGHTVEISEWITKNKGNAKEKSIKITKPEFDDLMQNFTSDIIEALEAVERSTDYAIGE